MKLISGMHRSGTSLVARLSFAAGADMGDPRTFYEPDRWNPDGYFEQKDIHAVNMPLINGSLGKLSYFFLPSEETIHRRGRVRAGQIRLTGAKYRGKVVKENRFCLTLGAWLEQGTQVERILVVLREPAAVARSLQRRNHITRKKAYSLWLVHYQRLLETARRHGIPFGFVRYESLLDPALQSSEAASALDFLGLTLSSQELTALVDSAVKPNLNHHSGPTHSAHYPAQVRALWEDLVAAHRRQHKDCRQAAAIVELGSR